METKKEQYRKLNKNLAEWGAQDTSESDLIALLPVDVVEAINDARDCMRHMTPYEDPGEIVEEVCWIKKGTFTKRRQQIKLLDILLNR